MPFISPEMPDIVSSGYLQAVTDPPLREAHNLLAASFDNQGGPGAFGFAATLLTLASIAAASAIEDYDLHKNKNRQRDRLSFIACMERYFPWDKLRIEGLTDIPKQLPNILYTSLRNPMVHSGGVRFGLQWPNIESGEYLVEIRHTYPGLASFAENLSNIDEMASRGPMGDSVLTVSGQTATVYTHGLYLGTRRLIENMAYCPEVQRKIAEWHSKA